jgi:hypothetical protein
VRAKSTVFVSIQKCELDLVSSPSCQDASEAVRMTCWRCPEGRSELECVCFWDNHSPKSEGPSVCS